MIKQLYNINSKAMYLVYKQARKSVEKNNNTITLYVDFLTFIQFRILHKIDILLFKKINDIK